MQDIDKFSGPTSTGAYSPHSRNKLSEAKQLVTTLPALPNARVPAAAALGEFLGNIAGLTAVVERTVTDVK